MPSKMKFVRRRKMSLENSPPLPQPSLPLPPPPRKREPYFGVHDIIIGYSGLKDADVMRMKTAYHKYAADVRSSFIDRSGKLESSLLWCIEKNINPLPTIAHPEINVTGDSMRKSLVRITKCGTNRRIWCSWATHSLYVTNVGNDNYVFRFSNDKEHYDPFSGKDTFSLGYEENYASLGYGGSDLSNQKMSELFEDVYNATPDSPPLESSIRTLASIVSESPRFRAVEDILADACFQFSHSLREEPYPVWLDAAVLNWGHISFDLQVAREDENENMKYIDISDKCDTSNSTQVERKKVSNAHVIHVGKTYAAVLRDVGILKRKHSSPTETKTCKYDIEKPLDPSGFAAALIQLYVDSVGKLPLVASALTRADVNLSRHGDLLFEPESEGMLVYIFFVQSILRTKPSLQKNLENYMEILLLSLKFFDEKERKRLAQFTALAFSEKLSGIGLKPETFFQPLLKDNLVAKGIVLSFMTDFFKEYLVDNSFDDLVAILKRGKMEENLLDIFPSAKRTPEGFSEHFTKEGLLPLVEYNEKKLFEVRLKEMKSALTTQIQEEADISEIIDTVKQRVKEAKLPEIEVVRILWDILMDSVQWSGKYQQQNANAALRQVKTWAGLLNTFCTNGKLELELINKVQIQCYEDAKLMKLFPEIIKSLYDQDVLAEDTILHWYRKGDNPKGRQTFVKAIEPFVNCLEEAEEEE